MVQKTLRHHRAFHFPKRSALPLTAKRPEALQKGGEMPLLPQQWAMWCMYFTRPSPVRWIETPRNPPADSAGAAGVCSPPAPHRSFSPRHLLPCFGQAESTPGLPRKPESTPGHHGKLQAPVSMGCHWRPCGARHNGCPQLRTQAAPASEEHHAGLIYFQRCSFSLHLRGETHITGSHFHDFVAIRISWIRGWFIRTPCGCEEVSSQGQCGVNYILSTPPLLIAGYKKYKRKKKLQMWNIWMNSLRQQRDLQISPSDVYTSTLCSFKTRNLY